MFTDAETRVLSQLAHGPGKTKVAVRSLGDSMLGGGLVRVDITNMTRDVNHHFESSLDGHQRKYRLHVEVNASATALARAAGSVAYPAKLSVRRGRAVRLLFACDVRRVWRRRAPWQSCSAPGERRDRLSTCHTATT